MKTSWNATILLAIICADAATIASAGYWDCKSNVGLSKCCKGGSYACLSATGPISDGACNGSSSCRYSQAVGEYSCHGTNACEGRRGVAPGLRSVGARSCHGYVACRLASTVGSNSCLGDFACSDEYETLTIHDNSCHGNQACHNSDGSMHGSHEVGENSCIGDYACQDCFGSVGSGSCIGDDSCKNSIFYDIPDCCLTYQDYLDDTCGKMCPDGCNYDVHPTSECPTEVVQGFGRCINGCVSGNNIRIYSGVTLAQCMVHCKDNNNDDGTSTCVGVEYFTRTTNGFRKRDCAISSSVNTSGCNNELYYVAFYPTQSSTSAHHLLMRNTDPEANIEYFVDPQPWVIASEYCVDPDQSNVESIRSNVASNGPGEGTGDGSGDVLVVDLNALQITFTPRYACLDLDFASRAVGGAPGQCAQACAVLANCVGFVRLVGEEACVLADGDPEDCQGGSELNSVFYERDAVMHFAD